MRSTSMRGVLALLLITAACDSESAAPPITAPPVDPPAVSFPVGLWSVSGAPSEIIRLDPSQLLDDGIKDPATRLFTSSASLFTLSSVAFDSLGTMWVASQDDSLLLAFTPRPDGSSGFTTPSIIISPVSRSIARPTGIAFDREHRMWIANFEAGTIVRFDRSQLVASGAPAPAVTISGIAHPTSIAFDASGALWVSDIIDNTVSRYLVGQLLTSGDKPPAIVLSSSSGSLVHPAGIAFDSFNNLWVANTGNQSVVAFRPPQRGETGAPAPFLTLKPELSPLESPAGLAFDADGSLWVMGITGMLTKFTLSSIAGSGPAEPSLRIQLSNRILFWSVAFWPKIPGLLLN